MINIENIGIKSLLESFDNALEPIIITTASLDEGVEIIFVNEAFCRETLYEKYEIIGQSPSILYGRRTNYNILEQLRKDLQDGKNFVGQNINYKKDGTEYMAQWSVSHLKDEQNQTIAYISFQKIITKYMKIKNDNFLLQAVVKSAPGMILVTDLEAKIVYANDSFCQNVGYSQASLVGKHSKLLKSGQQDSSFYKSMWQTLIKEGEFEGIFVNKKKDGTIYYDKKKIKTISDENGKRAYYFSVSYDITQERRNKQKMLDEIYLDSLTEQFNRKKYEEVIQEKIKEGKEFSIILMDIDFFKKVNDDYGHDKGDFILKEFSRLVKAFMIFGKDELFRWGGEEFVVITDRNIEEARNIADVLKNMIFQHDFEGLHVSVSMGITQMKKDKDKTTLFKLADKALYEAKASGRNKIVVYE